VDVPEIPDPTSEEQISLVGALLPQCKELNWLQALSEVRGAAWRGAPAIVQMARAGYGFAAA